MAKVTAKKLGGELKELEASTVAEVRKALELGANYKGSVNGEPQEDSYSLEDYEFVSFAEAVKGGI